MEVVTNGKAAPQNQLIIDSKSQSEAEIQTKRKEGISFEGVEGPTFQYDEFERSTGKITANNLFVFIKNESKYLIAKKKK